MHQMLGTNLFPKINGIVAGAPVPGPTGTNVTLSLKIRKKTLDLPVRITAWKETPHEITFHADWELSLKAFGLKPPSVIGLIRVGDQVNLEADVSAAKTTVVPSTPNPAP